MPLIMALERRVDTAEVQTWLSTGQDHFMMDSMAKSRGHMETALFIPLKTAI